MSRRSKRVTAAMLALLMVVSSSFSQVTTVQATELEVVASQEAGTEATTEATTATQDVAEEKEAETQTVETTTESNSVETSQEVQTSTEATTESNTVETSQGVQTSTEVTTEVAVLAETGDAQTDATVKTAKEAVYFSEYIEAAFGSNKALEIYNGTDATISLSEYSILYYTNGNLENVKTYKFPDGATIAGNGVWVAMNSSTAIEGIKAVANEKNSTYANFNGDDVICLYHNQTLIDTLGVTGDVDWAVDKTLVRKDDINVSSPVYNADEWTVYNNSKEYTEIKYLGTRYGEYKAPSEEESGTEDTENKTEITTIATVKETANGEFTVKGIVTFVDGKNVYLQDETAGIDAYFSTADSEIAIGDTLTVTGTYTTYNGLVELKNAVKVELVKATAETVLPCKEVTLAELKADYEAAGLLESTRVYIKNVTLGEVNTSGNTTLTDEAGNSYPIYRVPALTAVEEGDVVNVYAVVGDYMGLQLRVAQAEDITLVEKGETVVPDAPVVEDTFPAEGDYVIWAPAYNKALSANYSSYNNVGVDVTYADGVLSGYGNTEVWTITVASEKEKTYYVSHNGQKLSMDTGYTSMPLNKINDTWVFEEADDGCFYMKNVGRGYYAEWYAKYSNWSAYSTIYPDSVGMFALKFTKAAKQYAVDENYTGTVASWGGGMIPSGNESPITDTVVKGDLYDINDKLDATSEFTVVLDGKNAVTYTDANNSKNNHYMGSAGFGADDYLQFATSAYGYGNMDLSFRMRVTNAAPAEYQLQYSTDGVSFKNFTTGSYNAKYTVYTSDGSSEAEYKGDITNGIAKFTSALAKNGVYVTFNFDVPSAAAHAEKLYIRIVGGSAKANGSTGAPSGNVRIDTVTIKGNPIVSDDIVGYVSTTTPVSYTHLTLPTMAVV